MIERETKEGDIYEEKDKAVQRNAAHERKNAGGV